MFKKKTKKDKKYPRDYSDKELGDLIDKYGDISADKFSVGPSYFAKASLGVSELQRRSSQRSERVALVVLFISVSTLFLTKQQVDIAKLQAIPEQINQAQQRNRAVDFCRDNPDSTQTYLANTETGEFASCNQVLELYGN